MKLKSVDSLSLAELERESLDIELHLRDRARGSLLEFIRYTYPEYEAITYHQVICAMLDEWIKKTEGFRNIIITTPPRHGKSEIVSRRAPAFILGKIPHAKIIATSYGDDLAKSMSRDVQSIMDSPEYVALFPHAVLPGRRALKGALNFRGRRTRNASTFQLQDFSSNAMYVCAGVGGPITGKGADYLIIDDPIKNAQDAESITVRDSQWHWYTSTARTRLSPGGCQLLTLTRWHEDDLAGRILQACKTDPKGEQWLLINLPAINEDGPSEYDFRAIGESLWPTRYPIEELEKIKRLDIRVWTSLYQCRPAPDEGGMFPRNCWEYLDVVPEMTMRVRYWDRAATRGGGDWTVGLLMGVDKKGVFYVLDVVRLQGSPLDVEQRILTTAKADGRAVTVGIEQDPGQAGKFESDYYLRLLAGYDVKIVPARDSKETRARPYSSQVLGKNMKLKRAAWNAEFVEEHINFPYGKYDDQVDCGSGAFLLCSENTPLRMLQMLTTGVRHG